MRSHVARVEDQLLHAQKQLGRNVAHELSGCFGQNVLALARVDRHIHRWYGGRRRRNDAGQACTPRAIAFVLKLQSVTVPLERRHGLHPIVAILSVAVGRTLWVGRISGHRRRVVRPRSCGHRRERCAIPAVVVELRAVKVAAERAVVAHAIAYPIVLIVTACESVAVQTRLAHLTAIYAVPSFLACGAQKARAWATRLPADARWHGHAAVVPIEAAVRRVGTLDRGFLQRAALARVAMAAVVTRHQVARVSDARPVVTGVAPTCGCTLADRVPDHSIFVCVDGELALSVESGKMVERDVCTDDFVVGLVLTCGKACARVGAELESNSRPRQSSAQIKTFLDGVDDERVPGNNAGTDAHRAVLCLACTLVIGLRPFAADDSLNQNI
mmetsp:Transcript_41103/g.60318  ORF Transcript_41103/g.60318 Transcript_41103/m.60318 type:complete len:386 (-) Transcript_41103:1453-2610(-)